MPSYLDEFAQEIKAARLRYAELGRLMKSSEATDEERTEYLELKDWMKFFKTEEKYLKWKTEFFKPAYDKAHDLHRYNGATEKQAHKRATQDAVEVVAAKTGYSARGIRKALQLQKRPKTVAEILEKDQGKSAFKK